MAIWSAYRALAFYLMHLTIYFILRCCQTIYWRIVGIQKHLESCKYGENYEMSAQLLKVWSRSKSKCFTTNYQRHFISTHVKFVHPEYALQKHITLMTVTDKEAIFCVPSPQENILNVRKWPFLFHAQHVAAEYILVMPISSFIRLAETLGDPKAKIIWIHNTGRCGSTAIAQAFNALPNIVSISEPICIFSINEEFKYKYFEKWGYDWKSSAEYLNIYRSTVRLLLKPSLKTAEVIAVKPPPLTSKRDIHLIPKVFPKFDNIFMYRDVKAQATSLYRILKDVDVEAEVTLAIATNPWLSAMLPRIKPYNLMCVICDDQKHIQWLFSKENLPKSTYFTQFTCQWAETCMHFRELIEGKLRGRTFPALKYEHWESDRDKYLKTLFDCIGLELTDERYRLVKEALNEDSQKCSVVNRESTKLIKVEITSGMIEEVNRYLRYYELPEWGESLTLPNTVTSY